MKLTIVLLACICSLSGCSLAGYLTGSGIDRNAPDFDTLTTHNNLDTGDDVTIYKKDGSIASGTVAEPLQSLSFEEKLTKITGTSSSAFDLRTGSFSNPTNQIQSVPTTIVLKDLKNDTVRISMDSIEHIVTPHKKHAAFTGFLVGAAVDIAVVAIIASGLPVFKGTTGFNLGE